MIDIDARARDRLIVLVGFYHAANGNTRTPFLPSIVQEALGWNDDRFQDAYDWVTDCKCIEQRTFAPEHFLTKHGRDSAEKAMIETKRATQELEAAKRPTVDYRPGNYI